MLVRQNMLPFLPLLALICVLAAWLESSWVIVFWSSRSGGGPHYVLAGNPPVMVLGAACPTPRADCIFPGEARLFGRLKYILTLACFPYSKQSVFIL